MVEIIFLSLLSFLGYKLIDFITNQENLVPDKNEEEAEDGNQ